MECSFPVCDKTLKLITWRILYISLACNYNVYDKTRKYSDKIFLSKTFCSFFAACAETQKFGTSQVRGMERTNDRKIDKPGAKVFGRKFCSKARLYKCSKTQTNICSNACLKIVRNESFSKNIGKLVICSKTQANILFESCT